MCEDNEEHKVYVVTVRLGDGYHLMDVEINSVWLSKERADERHAQLVDKADGSYVKIEESFLQ